MWYRELFESLWPTTVQAEHQITYRFDTSSLPDTFPTTDLVQWGTLQATPSVGGMQSVSPFNPSPSDTTQLSSANTIWMRFKDAGHIMWQIGMPPTIFLRDASVYASPVYDVVLDFVNGSGVLKHELPIVHTWLAGLQLVEAGGTNRIANFVVPFYAPPQTYMGYRINSFNLGARGSRNQVRLQKIDIAELMIQIWATMTTVNNLQSENSTTSGGTVVFDPVNPNNYGDLLEIFTRAACAVAFWNESGLTVGCQDPYSNFTALPFGQQFLLPSASSTAAWPHFELFVESLRRYKYVGQKYKGVPTYIVNAPMSSQMDSPYKLWLENALTNFNYLTMSTSGPTYYNYTPSGNTGPSMLGGFVITWQAISMTAQNFVKYGHCSAEVESLRGSKGPVQQLTWFARGIPPNGNALRERAPKLYEQWAKQFQDPFDEGLQIIQTSKGKTTVVTTVSERPKWAYKYSGGIQNYGIPPGAQAFAGTFACMIFRRPYRAEQNQYLCMVLPLVYVDDTQASITNSIALAVARHMGTVYLPANGSTKTYYSDEYFTASSMCRMATQSAVLNELQQIFKNNADLGLGGALGSLANWIGGKVAKKHPKLGAAIEKGGGVVDGLLGMTRFGGLNNEIGTLVGGR
jgi:hypothetical protein